jgi:hypothetical protein
MIFYIFLLQAVLYCSSPTQEELHMPTTNDMYTQALADRQESGKYHGYARHMFANGGELICAVDRVAGRSITRLHMRTTYHYVMPGEKYSKQISRKRAAELLA